MLHVFHLTISLLLGLAISTIAQPVEEAENVLSTASWSFGTDLLKAVSKNSNSNVLMSPVSVGTLLSMLQQGARETTLEELETVLKLSANASKEAFSSITPNLRGDFKNVTIEWGNAIYVKKGFELKDSFKTSVEDDFQSHLEEMEFEEDAPQRINDWVNETTHGEITNLIDPGSLTDETVMVLLNAIYFKGVWASPFEKVRTRKGVFEYTRDNKTVTSFMRKDDRFPAGEDLNLGIKWLELPYEDNRFSMLFILPIEKHGLQAVLDKITGADLQRIASSKKNRYVFLAIPKFKLTKKISLVDTLSEMGLKDLFTEDSNLEGMSPTHKNLHVSKFIHQCNVEIDEDGTTAAAASYSLVQVLSLITYPDEMVFDADHPFLIFIVDKESKVPLFLGKIATPVEAEPPQNSSSVEDENLVNTG